MRILYHHRTLADGAEGIHIAEMIAALRAEGHEVHVHGLAASDTSTTARQWISAVRSRVPRVIFELASIAGNLVEYVQVRRAIAALKPDLVYKRHARNDVGALWAARHGGVPVALEVNCLFTGPRYERFEPLALAAASRSLERTALKLASWRFAVSSPLAHDIEALGAGATIVLPNGADPAFFDPERVEPAGIAGRLRASSPIIVGWTGVLRDWHGLDLLLRAVARLDGYQLLVVGDGPARPAVEALAATLGMSERLTITGRVPHGDMPRYIAAMDVAVVADDRTGVASPMKLLEYMAMGRAVVAPHLPNISDVIVDRENGWLFAAGDEDALAGAIRALAQSADLRARLGRAARETIVRDRNWRQNALRVLGHAALDAGARSRLRNS